MITNPTTKFKKHDRVYRISDPNKTIGTVMEVFPEKSPWKGSPYRVRFPICTSYFTEEELEPENQVFKNNG
ncbi:MAG: hypothetical protein WC341_00595 [Bacteroidales bacterium]|jgi:hypothetical protein